MKIAVQVGGPEEFFGTDEAYRIIHEAGFEAVDVNTDHLLTGEQLRNRERPEVFTTEDDAVFYSYFQPWKDAAEKYGIENYQAHAIFPTYLSNDEDYNAFLLEALKKNIKGCAYIGCHKLIVHPFFLSYNDHMDPRKEWDLNIRSYGALIETAKQYDVLICLENMFSGYRGKLYEACCSDISTACRYIDTLNEMAGQKCFGFCLDTGHALLCSKDIYDTMVELGDRIEAFHVHDNNGTQDQHLAPYMGILDWNRFVDGLRAIHYDKTLSFETFNIWNTADPEVCPELMRFIYRCGRMFAERAGL